MQADSSEPIVEAVAAFVHNLEFEDVPAEAVPMIEQAFVDTVGVTLAGTLEDTAQIASRLVAEPYSAPNAPASLLGRAQSGSATDAAFVNATAGHALDFDDTHGTIALHPSVTMVAPLFAVAQTKEATDEVVSGADLVTAYAAGFEVESVIGDLFNPAHIQHGWHPTGTLGAFGAAAAAARLLDLDRDATRNAITIAASTAAGLRRNFGSMTKPMHAGQAARSGLTAAVLAEGGFTARDVALFGDEGFTAVYNAGVQADVDQVVDRLNRWSLVEDGILFKKYPACGRAQTSIEATAQLVSEHDIKSTDVDSIEVSVAGSAIDALQYDRPTTGRQAKFSIQYAIAAAILNDHIGLATFETDEVLRPAARELVECVTKHHDDSLPYTSRMATVVLRLNDGRTVEQRMEFPPGHPRNPLTSEEVQEKFVATAAPVIGEQGAVRAFERLDSLATNTDIGPTLASF